MARNIVTPICKIDGCDSEIVSLGMCCAHYTRHRRHGNPNAGRARNGDPLRWVNDHVDYVGDDCIKWPYSSKPEGYGVIRYLGSTRNASRVMCIIAHGEPSGTCMEAAHSCGNGHLGCMNPNHISWKTRKENVQDAISHGTWMHGEASPHSKLTEQQARKIALLKGKVRQKDLAKMYGVSSAAISRIHSSKAWAWMGENTKGRSAFSYGGKHHIAKLTPDDVRNIRTLRGSLKQSEIGLMFGVDKSHVGKIQRRECWSHVK